MRGATLGEMPSERVDFARAQNGPESAGNTRRDLAASAPTTDNRKAPRI